MSRAQLLSRAGLDEGGLCGTGDTLDLAPLLALLRFAQAHTRDPGLGLQLACLVDLRQLGFWGYAVLSSHSLRERVETHVRYQQLRAPWRIALLQEGDTATLDLSPAGVPADVLETVVDWLMATVLLHLRSHLGHKPQGLQLSLSYPARPHHRELADLFEGQLVFDAPCVRLRAPAQLLDMPLPGDRYLNQLVRAELDDQLERDRERGAPSLLDRVRERISARLGHDPSLVRIAGDLGVSARTLQRQLELQATQFHVLLDEVRRALALEHMGGGQRLGVQRVAALLGYADASSFRRAFRRWTGLSPERYRSDAAARVRGVRSLSLDARKPARKVPGARARAQPKIRSS